MSNRRNNKYDHIRRFIRFFNLDDAFCDDFERDYEDNFDYNEEYLKEKELKENVKDKLLTDEKYTFEEYFTLLELVSNKFKTSFNSGNGKYEIIFRERTFDERFKLNINNEDKQTDEKEREVIENERYY